MITTNPRYLTKSRFKLALDCPTKLFYTRKKDEYADTSQDNDFLRALARGGYQVGELAKYYYPGGHDIETLDYEEALTQTDKLLEKNEVIIYEAAIRFQNLFIRVDILKKSGNYVQMIEVKSKSYKSVDDFTGRGGTIKSEWKPYLYDVAFQKYVLCSAKPGFSVDAFLMLADKNASATVEGLNQRFLFQTENSRLSVKASNTEDLGEPVLKAEEVNDLVGMIWSGTEVLNEQALSFGDYVHKLAEIYEKDEQNFDRLSGGCKGCEFRLAQAEMDGLKSGYHECWKEMAGFKDEDFEKPSMLDVWDFRKKDDFIENEVYLQEQMTREDLEPKTQRPNNNPGFSRVDRQDMQIEKAKSGDMEVEFDINGLRTMMDSFKFPLHFIDFETTMVAIPFNQGRHPYEQMAFQYSHHTMDENGVIAHVSEWINLEPGKFPNLDFIRALKKDLKKDDGTIFRYSHHENTVLNQIRVQLEASEEADKDELVEFIRSITQEKDDRNRLIWEGPRNMVDLCQLYKWFHFDPQTKGSNSLKAVLPAILNRSEFLQKKYSRPIYGTEIKSLNFSEGIAWLQEKDGEIISPYKQLPKLFKDWTRDELDQRITDGDEDLADGGAAMIAYAMMQFTEMGDRERQHIKQALLRYCELDTMAMIMLYEYWLDVVKNG